VRSIRVFAKKPIMNPLSWFMINYISLNMNLESEFPFILEALGSPIPGIA